MIGLIFSGDKSYNSTVIWFRRLPAVLSVQPTVQTQYGFQVYASN